MQFKTCLQERMSAEFSGAYFLVNRIRAADFITEHDCPFTVHKSIGKQKVSDMLWA